MERQPVTAVPGALWNGFTQTAAVVVRIPQKMVGIVQAAFGSGQRDPNGPISVVGVTRAAGEIASSDSIPFVQTPRERVSFFLSLLASLNLALFVFNLIPLLPLDGGHVAGRAVGGRCGAPSPGCAGVPTPARRRRAPAAHRLRHEHRADRDVGAADLRRHRQAREARRLTRSTGCVSPAVGAGEILEA